MNTAQVSCLLITQYFSVTSKSCFAFLITKLSCQLSFFIFSFPNVFLFYYFTFLLSSSTGFEGLHFIFIPLLPLMCLTHM